MAIFIGVVLAIVAAVSWGLGMVVHRLDRARRNARAGRYEWQPQRERVARRLKGMSRLPEDRQALLEFIRTRQGVEAYVEPRTLVSP